MRARLIRGLREDGAGLAVVALAVLVMVLLLA